MQHQVFGAKGEGSLNLSAKGHNTLLSNLFVLAAHVDQIARMNHQRANVILGAKCGHPLALLGSDLGRLPHARAGGKYLESISADFAGALNRGGSSAACAEMDTDAFRMRHED